VINLKNGYGDVANQFRSQPKKNGSKNGAVHIFIAIDLEGVIQK
tara:strand:- start:2120 stop:2251 length:132 start_codon:yes stop_codon:yes gene_type:complete